MSSAASRKAHRKSRKGCAECKRRHVKCDEKRPICSTCKRLELPCSYGRNIVVQPQILSPSSSITPLSSSDFWNKVDLELLHHYTSCCCVQVPGTHRRKIWTNEIVQLSFSHDYLLHQILAVSALHLHIQNPHNPDYVSKATSHRARALEYIQPVLGNMTAELCIPVFAFAGVTMLYAFAELTLRLEDEGEEHDTIHHISECFKLNRGIHAVVSSYHDDIAHSWAGELINLSNASELDRLALLNQRMVQADSLHELVNAKEPRPFYNSAYHEALELLMNTIQILLWHEDDHPSLHLVNAWPSTLKPEFWQLLDAKEPVALVILAYFAVAMRLRPSLWWFYRWPELLITEIENALGEGWEEVLRWPKSMLQNLADS